MGRGDASWQHLTAASIGPSIPPAYCSPTATVDGRGGRQCFNVEEMAQRRTQPSSPAKAVPVSGLRRTPRLFRKGPLGPFRSCCVAFLRASVVHERARNVESEGAV
jgi:hypothetical protein